jgi:hypothetical protein
MTVETANADAYYYSRKKIVDRERTTDRDLTGFSAARVAATRRTTGSSANDMECGNASYRSYCLVRAFCAERTTSGARALA